MSKYINPLALICYLLAGLTTLSVRAGEFIAGEYEVGIDHYGLSVHSMNRAEST